MRNSKKFQKASHSGFAGNLPKGCFGHMKYNIGPVLPQIPNDGVDAGSQGQEPNAVAHPFDRFLDGQDCLPYANVRFGSLDVFQQICVVVEDDDVFAGRFPACRCPDADYRTAAGISEDIFKRDSAAERIRPIKSV